MENARLRSTKCGWLKDTQLHIPWCFQNWPQNMFVGYQLPVEMQSRNFIMRQNVAILNIPEFTELSTVISCRTSSAYFRNVFRSGSLAFRLLLDLLAHCWTSNVCVTDVFVLKCLNCFFVCLFVCFQSGLDCHYTKVANFQPPSMWCLMYWKLVFDYVWIRKRPETTSRQDLD